MHVARVISSVSSRESWTVLGADDAPVAPVERYLAYLSDIERSPNTVKAYAHDLKDWFTFLADRGLDWQAVRLADGVSSWRGCGCRCRPAMGGWWCCRRWRITARNRL